MTPLSVDPFGLLRSGLSFTSSEVLYGTLKLTFGSRSMCEYALIVYIVLCRQILGQWMLMWQIINK